MIAGSSFSKWKQVTTTGEHLSFLHFEHQDQQNEFVTALTWRCVDRVHPLMKPVSALSAALQSGSQAPSGVSMLVLRPFKHPNPPGCSTLRVIAPEKCFYILRDTCVR